MFSIAQSTPLSNASIQFYFDDNTNSNKYEFKGDEYHFTEGINGKALVFKPDRGFHYLTLNRSIIDYSKDFTVQFWVQTLSKQPMVLLSQKQFTDKSISSQKNKGWVLYTSGGTFAWNVGSGTRRLNYERENGNKLPLCDGKWHLLTMTYSNRLNEFRLYYDGQNKAIYKVDFDFSNNNPLVIGSKGNSFEYNTNILPQIKAGGIQLQKLVDAFNSLNIEKLENNEFIDFIVDPNELIRTRDKGLEVSKTKIDSLKEIRKVLLKNPYTVFQNLILTNLKPISSIYYLDNGTVKINKDAAQLFTQLTRLYPSTFAMDDLSIISKALDAEEVFNEYTKFKKTKSIKHPKKLKSLCIGDWNIWHGGKHFTLKKDLWDSRMRVVEMIKKLNIDVILLQETYSSGDFIAAELGYYLVEVSDWDYCFQESNISIISKYPIKEVFVPKNASFMNIGAKLTISSTQDIYVMSNWYGMSAFANVYDFHKDRFKHSDSVPVFFGGDFNNVPHTDGGDSPASKKLLQNGFTDAYRSLYPDISLYPGFTHTAGERIDQLYYKGKGLKNISTKIISEWPGGFPSDHFIIISNFRL